MREQWGPIVSWCLLVLPQVRRHAAGGSSRRRCQTCRMPVPHSCPAEFLHVKPGKGAAFVRSKLKNFITNNTVRVWLQWSENTGAL